ncbi:hypothetical protein ASPCAL13967 [Aspergillus calidoustus]|uniref:Rhodopsin domain-containing protein n=1 Tax=Aspergillus calidoustus TaxID=454130 RepID=A0A0U5GFZ7_ASPCI|nr:hypothetical protein ASPCAL13967 [Aspergillus calidoustus]
MKVIRLTADDPVSPPPIGVTPDFNASSGHLQTASTAIAAVGIAISTICLLIRIYTKARLLRKFWFDDVSMILAWVLSVSSQAILLYGHSRSCYGIHIWNFTISRLTLYQRTVLAASVLYIPALALAKLAILMLYYILLRTITDIWKYIICTVAFLISGYSIAFVLAIIFACSPVAKSWDPTITNGSCIDVKAIYLGSVVTNTASDVILILIAVPIVCKLRLPLLQRLGVIALFGVGCLTIITSIVRLATIGPFLASKDPTYKVAVPIMLIFIEGNFIILCGSLPYLRAFLRHYAPRWIGESNQSRGHGSDESSKRRDKGQNPGFPRLQDDIERAIAIDVQPTAGALRESVTDSQGEQGVELTSTRILHMSSARGHV